MVQMCIRCEQSKATVDVLCAGCNTVRETARYYAHIRQMKMKAEKAKSRME